MDGVKIERALDIEGKRRNLHEGYDYIKRDFVPIKSAKQCTVAVYEIMPGNSAYPYHFHAQNEEVFYIISGEGALKTPEGVKMVRAGDIIYFPSGEPGAHKLTNTSETERLIYIDFDTLNAVDVAQYPDSGKIAIWGMNINKVFNADTNVGYYEGE